MRTMVEIADESRRKNTKKPLSEQMQKVADRYEKATGKKLFQKTNADHIRSMTDDELARMLWKTGRNYRAICADPVVDFKEHSAELMNWLKQPYKEETK